MKPEQEQEQGWTGRTAVHAFLLGVISLELAVGALALASVSVGIARDLLYTRPEGVAGGIAVFDIVLQDRSINGLRTLEEGTFVPASGGAQSWPVTWRYQKSWGSEIMSGTSERGPTLSPIHLVGWVEIPADAAPGTSVTGVIRTRISFPSPLKDASQATGMSRTSFANAVIQVRAPCVIHVATSGPLDRVLDRAYLWAAGGGILSALVVLLYALLALVATVLGAGWLLGKRRPRSRVVSR